MEDAKYVVFKRDEFEEWSDGRYDFLPGRVCDAVVIRRQDMFAASALDTYADSISVAISVMRLCRDGEVGEQVKRLQGIADYFREQAYAARDTFTKIPD